MKGKYLNFVNGYTLAPEACNKIQMNNSLHQKLKCKRETFFHQDFFNPKLGGGGDIWCPEYHVDKHHGWVVHSWVEITQG